MNPIHLGADKARIGLGTLQGHLLRCQQLSCTQPVILAFPAELLILMGDGNQNHDQESG